jgi:hypothetical protein
MDKPYSIRKWITSLLVIVLGWSSGQSPAAEVDDTAPWRVSKAVGTPGWLDVSGTHRTRYETLDGQFRLGRSGGDQVLAMRTLLKLVAKTESFRVVGEVMDSRQELADVGTPINTTIVNAAELLQGYAAVRLEGPFLDGSHSELRLGRETIDLGSRRLVARNRFRNTINSFTGLDYQWEVQGGPVARAFYVLPTKRMPYDVSSLLNNDVQFDEENFDFQFWGFHLEMPEPLLDGNVEAYFFGMHESDSPGWPTANRRLFTPGLRWSRQPANGGWHYDFEGIVQFGSQRASILPGDTRDLDHFAYFAHGEVGYRLDALWSPLLTVLFDYASGDDSPTDDRSNRFDTLFGARRFEHGPTGIYGAFARSNIQSPGVRLSCEPVKSLQAMACYRPYWLASKRDAWTTSRLRDPSGNSGSFVGHQLEAMLRWTILPGNLRFEVGGAYLFAGEFIRSVPSAIERGDTAYGYASLDLTF